MYESGFDILLKIIGASEDQFVKVPVFGKKIVDNLEEAQKFILDIKKFATFKKEIVTIADDNLVNMKIVLPGFYHLPS
jgi:hypothetical protein